MTNRDKINCMSNDMLANILSKVNIAHNIRCNFCIFRGEDCLLTSQSCFDGIKAWLDTPVTNPENQSVDAVITGGGKNEE